jgi:membrane peptidoglycan carboxypeptidase
VSTCWPGSASLTARTSRCGTEGGSTITQQYVRNAYITLDQTVDRNSKEMVLAVKLEQRYPKDVILERYLNTIYFGRGAYGIQAAAAAYFGLPVDRLTLKQGAVLAAVIRDPYGYDPAVDADEAQGRWRWVLESMVERAWAPHQSWTYPELVRQGQRPALLAGPAGLIADQVERRLRAIGISAQQLRTGGLGSPPRSTSRRSGPPSRPCGPACWVSRGNCGPRLSRSNRAPETFARITAATAAAAILMTPSRRIRPRRRSRPSC